MKIKNFDFSYFTLNIYVILLMFLVAEVVRPAYFMLELEPQLYTFILTLFPLVV